MSSASEADTARVVVKQLLASTKSLPAAYQRQISREKQEFNLRDNEAGNEPEGRPRLRTRASFKFTEGLRKQGSVDFTTTRPRVFSKSKELPQIMVENPRAESVGSQRITTEMMPSKVGRVLRRQLTLDTIPDDSVFVENEDDSSSTTLLKTERKTKAMNSAPTTSSTTSSTTQRKVSVQQRHRKYSFRPFKTPHTSFSMVGNGRKTSVNISRKISKAQLARQPTINNINVPAHYQSRYNIRRSTLATSLPKVSIKKSIIIDNIRILDYLVVQ